MVRLNSVEDKFRNPEAFLNSGLEPLYIGDISVNQGFDLKLSNAQAFGVSDFKIDKVRINLDKFKVV